MEEILNPLKTVAGRYVPRLLTQACRDPDAPFFGCFDRNWWHYKIRDFPSAILQQGGYSSHLAGRLAEFSKMAPGLDAVATASVRFWNQRAQRHGAFEEYYPWEQGYPPLAFSTLSAAKLCLLGIGDTSTSLPGLKIAAAQLSARFEPRAANQQVAGLAALAAIRSISPDLVSPDGFDAMAVRTLALQHPEGWFMEYDGPDLGYLTVTMDCLWDLYDLTGEARFLDSAARAFAYVEWFVQKPGRGAGMHNARNTDYLVPYGFTRFCGLGGSWEERAGAILTLLYADSDHPQHFFAAVDDRYVSHYIGHSVIRAILTLEGSAPLKPPARPAPPPIAKPLTEAYLAGSGHWAGIPTLLVSGKKGGVFTWTASPDRCVSDFGWIVQRKKTTFVSHWWSTEWQIDPQQEKIRVSGRLYPHGEHESTPWKHFVLRTLSFFAGYRLTKLLKSLLIFKSQAGQLIFERQISRTEEGTLRVEDVVRGLKADDIVTRAPRTSKRHVASADSYHREDFSLVQNCSISEVQEPSRNQLRILTTYQLQA